MQNDVYELLINDTQAPTGSYNHAGWKLHTKGELNSEAVRIASVHEAMHKVLNDSTAYGLLLITLAHLAREKVIEKEQLSRLVNASRNAHEIYATYTSLLLTSSTDTDDSIIERCYPDYHRYVKQAQFILKGVEKRHLHYPIISACIEACFQNPALYDYLNCEVLFLVHIKDTPDHRLIELSKKCSGEKLNQWVDHFVRQYNDPDAARAHVTTEVFVESLGEKELIKYNNIQRALSIFIYQSLRRDGCFPMMDHDEHLVFLENMFQAVREYFPQIANTLPHANTSETQDLVTPISHYESEAVVYRDKLPVARLKLLKNLLSDELKKLTGKTKTLEYIYLVARITERFVSQYELEPHQKSWLVGKHPEFIIAISMTVENDELLFFILEDPKEIERLAEFHLLTSSSMLLLSDKRWSDWHDAISANSTEVTVFDLPPSEHIPRSFEIYDRVFYQSFYLELDGNEYGFVVLIGNSNSVSTGIFLMPCSVVMSNLLLEHMGKLSPHFQLLDWENDLSESFQKLIEISMTRLLEESHFNFNALNTQYARQGILNAEFYGT